MTQVDAGLPDFVTKEIDHRLIQSAEFLPKWGVRIPMPYMGIGFPRWSEDRFVPLSNLFRSEAPLVPAYTRAVSPLINFRSSRRTGNATTSKTASLRNGIRLAGLRLPVLRLPVLNVYFALIQVAQQQGGITIKRMGCIYIRLGWPVPYMSSLTLIPQSG